MPVFPHPADENPGESRSESEGEWTTAAPSPPPPLSRWRRIYPDIVLFLLLIGWPVLVLLSGPEGAEEFAAMADMSRLSVYLQTGLLLWIVFLLVWSAQWARRRPLAELGFTQPTMRDPLIALAFLFASNLILNGMVWILTSLGMDAPDMAVQALLPQNPVEKTAWVLLSISAGVCEESCFRGFILLQGRRWLGRWLPIVILSSVAFGVGHLYQGRSGAILIAIYGAMFCALRLWRGSLWPGIWAHIWQDLGAMALGVNIGSQ